MKCKKKNGMEKKTGVIPKVKTNKIKEHKTIKKVLKKKAKEHLTQIEVQGKTQDNLKTKQDNWITDRTFLKINRWKFKKKRTTRSSKWLIRTINLQNKGVFWSA